MNIIDEFRKNYNLDYKRNIIGLDAFVKIKSKNSSYLERLILPNGDVKNNIEEESLKYVKESTRALCYILKITIDDNNKEIIAKLLPNPESA